MFCLIWVQVMLPLPGHYMDDMCLFQGLRPKQAMSTLPGDAVYCDYPNFRPVPPQCGYYFLLCSWYAVGRPWGYPVPRERVPLNVASIAESYTRCHPSPPFFRLPICIGMDMCDACIFQWCRINYHTKAFWHSNHPRVGRPHERPFRLVPGFLWWAPNIP